MFLDFLVVVILLLANGYFSLSEMAVVTARPARLRELVDAKGASARGARVALDLKERPGRFLSTVQIGITLVGVYSGAFSGTQLAEPLSGALAGVPVIAAYADAVALGLVVLAITFLTLLIGELVPKNLALARPEALAVQTAPVMRLLSILMTPGVWLLDRVSGAVLALFGQSGANQEAVTEEEIRHFVREGAASGAIEDHERDMIYRVIRLGDKYAGDLMVPRRFMETLDIDSPIEETIETLLASRHDILPVIRDDPANVIGVLAKSDLMFAEAGSHDDVFRHMKDAVFVPEMTAAVKVLELFRGPGHRLAFVVDEYGTVKGLITLADLLAAIFGAEIEPLRGTSDIVRSDGSILVDGLKSAEDLRDLLGLRTLPGEEDLTYNTVAGMLIGNLGSLPKEGDTVEWEGWRFEVVDMDGTRIDKVLIARIEPIASE